MLMPPRVKSRTRAAEPTDPRRVRAFALFFKRYMSISTLVIAALPIPVTSLKLIPTFSAQSKLFSIYTSLFCFLILGLIFYLRHQLAKIMFFDILEPRDLPLPTDYSEDPSYDYRVTHMRRLMRFFKASLVGFLPFILIAASIFFAFQYNDLLVSNVRMITTGNPAPETGAANSNTQPPATNAAKRFDTILANTELDDIPNGSRLMLSYILIFITAEAAFVLMAIKEYLQDLIHLSEVELIIGLRQRDLELGLPDSETTSGAPPVEEIPPAPARIKIEDEAPELPK
jgi:hypothetical protein